MAVYFRLLSKIPTGASLLLQELGTVLSDILPAMNGGASHEEEGWRNAVNVV